MRTIREDVRLACSVAALLAAAATTASAEMTEEARAFLSENGIGDELIAQAAAATASELDVPAEWLEQAAAEGAIDFSTNDTSEHVAEWLPVFNARYPEIEIIATETSGAARAVQPLLAYNSGQLVRHIVVSFEGSLPDYLEADALEEIDDLPAWEGIPEDRRAADGTFAGMQNTTWCLVYNQDRVTQEELPATWWDLVAEDSPLAGGRVGAANRAQLWTLNLWTHPDYGPERMENEFLPAFFNNLQPQLRAEGVGGMINLPLVGEFDVGLPTPNDETWEMMQTGAPLGWHCPEPVPQYFNLIGMFRNSPTHYSSKVFINWLLSQEGQLVRLAAGGDGPVHRDLQIEGAAPLFEAFAGKDIALRTIDGMVNELPRLYEVWNPLWAAAGGPE
ncbi:ABC transporter substrate-binding protein [Wenxinia marina]|uniref:ABC-type Fe3+ transport system, periplasmic component n=1 Tax=Wenxinia marina DSM 24838 TaxID=1123501 RepID=A0A0D0NL10_9RHOB|nr:extracellular solute-binding protein [Wenxinia marina]KIQ68995.1 ABC-type Fe3+ transport system, periplasmic component [Wenxinia marina DSM 24838]